LIYHCIIAGSDKVIVTQGVAKKDIDNNIAAFKKSARTVKVKEKLLMRKRRLSANSDCINL
jgi:hypothetical protein